MGKCEKKLLLIVMFVFGEKYQEYIPLQFYSLYKNYPEYDAVVYVDSAINSKIEKTLTKIPGYQKKYLIDRIHIKSQGMSGVGLMEAYRWVMHYNIFDHYEYVYIGDIDIFICKEHFPLHEQHIQHMNAQKLCYSNVVRPCKVPHALNTHKKLLEKIGLYHFALALYNDFLLPKRFSGLHFVKVDTYYSAIDQWRKHYLSIYSGRGLLNRIYCWKSRWKYSLYSNNESLLYHIIKKSNLKLPKQMENADDLMLCQDSRSHNFRPMHGIHFGVWRGREQREYWKQHFLDKEPYLDYYLQFKELYETDPVLRDIIKRSSAETRRIINNMITDYEFVIGRNQSPKTISTGG